MKLLVIVLLVVLQGVPAQAWDGPLYKSFDGVTDMSAPRGPDESATVELDSMTTDRTMVEVGVPVPSLLCRKLDNTIVMKEYENGEWTLPDYAEKIDLGQCAGFCLTTYQMGKKSCEAVRTDSVILTHKTTGRKRKETIIRECACVCDRIERCPYGMFWNAWHCRCERKEPLKPCTRFPLYRYLGDFGLDVGMCKGECHWKGSFAYCRPLTFETQSVPPAYGQVSAVARTIEDCGCSDCHVKAKYRLIKVDDGIVQKVNVGYCDGECGPQDWPAGVTDVSNYWTSTCQVAATRTLVIRNSLKVEVVSRCDCKPVRPRCARVPHHVQHWGPDGTVQVVDIGRCLGRCPYSSQECVPKTEDHLVCGDSDPTTAQECGGIQGKQCNAGYECKDVPDDGCDPANGGADCAGYCAPKCDRFKVIVDCHCPPVRVVKPDIQQLELQKLPDSGEKGIPKN
eukprot:CAMPEP_0174286362 /NCGR_PEP_ID=MMETSP0809-20121228/11570_1 /TAXON_ID=73025 ORGANISM="Eutreptiella gymnastica-like, Strain CCMP1594" /NCGR_SAMPLE_ID=MMETSP0809 /ASSEMBLY_ACC=CAM_ASM_000658 /LENGTH=452 /DNA_ID=CAMNT_0015382395 /DNA_START=46 /DNA_END=1404 /DNA_ORIENTATION=+